MSVLCVCAAFYIFKIVDGRKKKKLHLEAKCSTQTICLAVYENCSIRAFSRTKKGETFSTAACLNRLRSAEHNPDLKN